MKNLSYTVKTGLVSQLSFFGLLLITLIIPATTEAATLTPIRPLTRYTDPSSYKRSIYQPPNFSGVPMITAPSQNAVLTNFPRRATLRWTPVAYATHYIVTVDCDTCAKSSWASLATYTTTATSYVTPALPGDNQYRFHVRAVKQCPDSCSTEKTYTAWSPYQYFRFNTAPAPAPICNVPNPTNTSADLFVSDIYRRTDMTDTATHKPLWFVQVRNRGNSCAYKFNIRLEGYTRSGRRYEAVLAPGAVNPEAGHTNPTWPGSLCSGTTQTGVNFVFNQNSDPIVSVRATVDSLNTVRESNEGNNTRYESGF